MHKFSKFFKHPIAIILMVLAFDQIVKIWVKTHMYLHEEFPVFGEWFIIHFTENNGMAFGMEFGGDWGKLFLSVFRIFAVGGIGYFLYKIAKDKAPTGVTTGFALIFAGAVGNIIDSVFYGVLFSESEYELAQFFPEDGGYAPMLYGKVVDMLYFPLIEGNYPDWIPFLDGAPFIFFRPVFNIADSAITIGVVCILLFQKDFFKSEKKTIKKPTLATSEK